MVLIDQLEGHGERVVQRDSVARYLRDGVLVVHAEDLLSKLEPRSADERIRFLVGLLFLQQFCPNLFVGYLAGGLTLGEVVARPDPLGRLEVLVVSVAVWHVLVKDVLFDALERCIVPLALRPHVVLKNMRAGKIMSTHLL